MNSPHDPFTALRAGEDLVTPSSTFAERLRDQLNRSAGLPRGVLVSGVDQAVKEHVVERPGALPYLSVTDARRAIDWYGDHLGARVRGEPILMDDGRIGHAELEVGGGVIYLAEQFPDMGLRAPAQDAVSVSLMLAVDDTDAALRSAADGGAHVQREPYENYGTRTAVIIDPFGHRWMLSGPVRSDPLTSAPEPIRAGDIGYLSLSVPDADRAVRFYGTVLGWEYDPETRQVTNLGHRLGIAETVDQHGIFAVIAVDDVDTATAAIGSAGGALGPDTGRPGVIEGVDTQGTRFAVYAPEPWERRTPQHPSGAGDMSYLTVSTRDSSEFRRFYAAVLGWSFTPGRIDDGWEVVGAHPQVGVAGGASEYVSVPMWSVADLDAALDAVRAAGGTVFSGPDVAAYGLTAECVDDQDIPFYLGQLG